MVFRLPSSVRIYFLGRFVWRLSTLRRIFSVLAALNLFLLVVDFFAFVERAGTFLTKAALFGLAFVFFVSFLLPSSFFPLRPPPSLRERGRYGGSRFVYVLFLRLLLPGARLGGLWADDGIGRDLGSSNSDDAVPRYAQHLRDGVDTRVRETWLASSGHS
ncbi:hypothetical protein GY631_6623 [Trichophyton interdigitale]|nr:hypothetical protein GY631_6623 [Trichophyton interdigitale]